MTRRTNRKRRSGKANLSVMHLVRLFSLFTVTLLLLFTIARIGFNLWQFHKIPNTPTLIQSFVQGFRFDMATIGLILIVPIVLVSLFSIFNLTRGLAKTLLSVWMLLALLVVLVLELITPYFLFESSMRPDVAMLAAIEKPVDLIAQLWSKYLVPAIIGLVLIVLIMVAFWSRLEIHRMLRYPVKAMPALVFAVVGAVLCLLAIRSNVDLNQPILGVDAAVISKQPVVNEISLNSTFKSAWNYVNSTGLMKLLPRQSGL